VTSFTFWLPFNSQWVSSFLYVSLVAANCAGLCLVKLYSLCVLCKGSGEKKNEVRRKEGK